MKALIAAGDQNGDGRNDLMAVGSSGQLAFYPGTNQGTFGPGTVVGTGWSGYSSVSAAGDLTGDGRTDLLAVRTSDGALVVAAGTGGGRVGTPTTKAGGWGRSAPWWRPATWTGTATATSSPVSRAEPSVPTTATLRTPRRGGTGGGAGGGDGPADERAGLHRRRCRGPPGRRDPGRQRHPARLWRHRRTRLRTRVVGAGHDRRRRGAARRRRQRRRLRRCRDAQGDVLQALPGRSGAGSARR